MAGCTTDRPIDRQLSVIKQNSAQRRTGIRNRIADRVVSSDVRRYRLIGIVVQAAQVDHVPELLLKGLSLSVRLNSQPKRQNDRDGQIDNSFVHHEIQFLTRRVDEGPPDVTPTIELTLAPEIIDSLIQKIS